MSGVFAELELGMIRERVRSGMANAKSKGVKLGRPQMSKDDIPQIFYRHYPAYASGNLNVSELARVCELSRNTVYKYIKLVQNS
jgi:DNA invertase Pin-like site-specific DNA recombinase